ncbi:MAG: 2-oxoisovalerate dehydrogenase [Candidatus Binataceae bacterium]
MVDSEIVFAVQESPEGGFEARALGHPIFTQSDTFDELKEMVRDAVSCHFENATRPRLIRLHLVRDEVTRA